MEPNASAEASPDGDFQHNEDLKGNHEGKSRSRFRFKSTRKSDREQGRGRETSSERQRDPGERHHHRSKRRKRSHVSPTRPDRTATSNDDTQPSHTSRNEFTDPDVAFRESLFDAMADDEGAEYWEGVYGQPIHTYSSVKKGPEGELERMTDEEYTAFVRAKMYEKTHQHLIEEKARRDAAKKERERLAKEGEKERREAERFRRQVEESLTRGAKRKSRKAWSERWDAYIKKWEVLGQGNTAKIVLASIPWPVESGQRKDVSLKEVEQFFLHAPTSGEPTEAQLAKILKAERVRWHPDKIQQKLGGQDVTEDVIQAVTEVFQFIDTVWSEVRSKEK